MERQPGLFGPTQSKEEAHALILDSERRQRLLRIARTYAYSMGKRQEGVTTQEILERMDKGAGLMDDDDRKLDQRWIGALWASNAMKEDFERVGYRIQKNDTRNCHAAPRATWRLRGVSYA